MSVRVATSGPPGVHKRSRRPLETTDRYRSARWAAAKAVTEPESQVWEERPWKKIFKPHTVKLPQKDEQGTTANPVSRCSCVVEGPTCPLGNRQGLSIKRSQLKWFRHLITMPLGYP